MGIEVDFLASKSNVTGLKSLHHVLRDVSIRTFDGLIFDSQGCPIWELAHEQLFWGSHRPDLDSPLSKIAPFPRKALQNSHTANVEVEQRKALLLEPRPEPNQRGLNVCSGIYLLHPFGAYAYGHLFDSMQRLFPLSNLDVSKSTLLTSSPARVSDFELHLRAAGFHENDRIDVSKVNQDWIFVDELHVGISPATHNNFSDESLRWFLNGYDREAPGRSEPRRRLYLSRNHAQDGMRGVLNEPEVRRNLSDSGFEVVLGDEPLTDLIPKLRSAEFVVAAHGAALANTVFCGSQTRVFEFCPDNRPSSCFKFMNKTTSMYYHFLLPGDGRFNIEIPIAMLSSLLASRFLN